jgi:hypothetical protein
LDFGLFGRFALTDDRMRDFCLSGQGLARDWSVPIPGSLEIPSSGGHPWLSALPLSSSARHSQRKKPDDHTSVIGLLKTTTACVAHRGSYLTKLFQSSYKGLIMDLYDYIEDRDGIAGKQDKKSDRPRRAECRYAGAGRLHPGSRQPADRGGNRYITTGLGATHRREGDGAESLAVVRYGLPTSRKNECKPGYPCANRAAARNTC